MRQVSPFSSLSLSFRVVRYNGYNGTVVYRHHSYVSVEEKREKFIYLSRSFCFPFFCCWRAMPSASLYFTLSTVIDYSITAEGTLTRIQVRHTDEMEKVYKKRKR